MSEVGLGGLVHTRDKNPSNTLLESLLYNRVGDPWYAQKRPLLIIRLLKGLQAARADFVTIAKSIHLSQSEYL